MATIVNKAPLNDTGSRPVSAHSTFPLNQRIAGSYRFGLYQPCYAEDTVPDDELPVKSAHDLRSMNLKAPLMADVELHKEFFDVPYTVMLPLNYEKVFVQPNIGEDIDAKEVGLNVNNLPLLFHGGLLAIAELIDTGVQSTANPNATFYDIFTLINVLSYTFSAGSLFSSLGMDLSGCYSIDYNLFPELASKGIDSVDDFIDYLHSSILKLIREQGFTRFDCTIDGHPFIVDIDSDGTSRYLSYRQFIERIYDTTNFTVSLGVSEFGALSNIEGITYEDFINNNFLNLNKPLSLGRPLAYQLSCAEFFTNSKVDYIYSAELYRQNIDSLMFSLTEGMNIGRDMFSWNGVDYLYDTLSAHNISKALNPQNFGNFGSYYVDLIRLLFGYNRSLRYVDYFTGSRTRPLAVGDVNVQVNDGYVNIVDTITKRWYAKFLNQVNRAGRKLSEYSRAMFPGLTMHRDFHDPMWLAHIADPVNPTETVNTANDQTSKANSTTANFFSNGERYAFEYKPEYYGICIGIMYFDIQRYYAHIIERNNFNVDRNDFFNPFLQFVGDQVVYKDELYSGAVHDSLKNFGYQGRDMQYKQKVDRCFGAFSNPGTLPGWLYIAPDNEDVRGVLEQSPDYIRAYPSELDPFYTQLTGWSPATYFHFIVINTNNCNAKRAMVANPQLD